MTTYLQDTFYEFLKNPMNTTLVLLAFGIIFYVYRKVLDIHDHKINPRARSSVSVKNEMSYLYDGLIFGSGLLILLGMFDKDIFESIIRNQSVVLIITLGGVLNAIQRLRH